MTPDQQFAANYAVQSTIAWATAAGAFATFLAVLVALFGKYIQAALLPPKLYFYIDNHDGDRQLSTFGDSEPIETLWCHVRVGNKLRAFSPASFVEVRLLAVEEFDVAGKPILKWKGETPLTWRSQDRLRKTPLTIGASYDCDLFLVAKDHFLMIMPPASQPIKFEKECHIYVKLKAFSLEADSREVKVKIDWDGGWPDGTQPTRRHLSYEIVE